jgi:hypothetical protein
MCGAFAKVGERALVKEAFPELDQQFCRLEDELRLRGKRNCEWGKRTPSKRKSLDSSIGLFCAGCDTQPTDIELICTREDLESWLARAAAPFNADDGLEGGNEQ